MCLLLEYDILRHISSPKSSMHQISSWTVENWDTSLIEIYEFWYKGNVQGWNSNLLLPRWKSSASPLFSIEIFHSPLLSMKSNVSTLSPPDLCNLSRFNFILFPWKLNSKVLYCKFSSNLHRIVNTMNSFWFASESKSSLNLPKQPSFMVNFVFPYISPRNIKMLNIQAIFGTIKINEKQWLLLQVNVANEVLPILEF